MKTFVVGMNRKQAIQLSDFCKHHEKTQFFFCKDQGAYFGSTAGSQSEGNFENCIIYMKGCDPEQNVNFYETITNRFGGDDFGEHFDVQLLVNFIASSYKRINFRFNKRSISVGFSS